MIYNKAIKEDIEQLTELRIAYLTEDNGKLKANDEPCFYYRENRNRLKRIYKIGTSS